MVLRITKLFVLFLNPFLRVESVKAVVADKHTFFIHTSFARKRDKNVQTSCLIRQNDNVHFRDYQEAVGSRCVLRNRVENVQRASVLRPLVPVLFSCSNFCSSSIETGNSM